MLPAAMSMNMGISSLLQRERQTNTNIHTHNRGQTQSRNEDAQAQANASPAIEGATRDETTRLTGGDGNGNSNGNNGRHTGYGYGARESSSNEDENEGNEVNGSNSNNEDDNEDEDVRASPDPDIEIDTDTDTAHNHNHNTPNREQDVIINLTRRLRCMFTAVTWPIVPLAVLVVLAFVYMIYGAILDWTASCSHPLHAFTAVSAFFICYAPNHPLARGCLFGYQQQQQPQQQQQAAAAAAAGGDNTDGAAGPGAGPGTAGAGPGIAGPGPARPLAVRRYDQLVHTLALIYVYVGMTLDQTCRADTSSSNSSNYSADVSTTVTATATELSTLDATSLHALLLDDYDDSIHINSCRATCPNLYPAFAAYVVTLEFLCWSLLLPLLCLPCIYLWFLRRAASGSGGIGIGGGIGHDTRLWEDEDDVRRNGNILAETVMAQLQDVKLVRVGVYHRDNSIDNDNDIHSDKEGRATDSDRVLIVPSAGDVVSDISQGKDSNNMLECCICMSDFVVQESTDEADTSPSTDTDTNTDIETGATTGVQGAEAGTSTSTDTDADTDIETGATNGLALPLPQFVLPQTETDDTDAIVQTKKCGHIFHKHCMASWVGGQWRGATLLGDDSPRRARRTTCPLCRNDLR